MDGNRLSKAKQWCNNASLSQNISLSTFERFASPMQLRFPENTFFLFVSTIAIAEKTGREFFFSGSGIYFQENRKCRIIFVHVTFDALKWHWREDGIFGDYKITIILVEWVYIKLKVIVVWKMLKIFQENVRENLLSLWWFQRK